MSLSPVATTRGFSRDIIYLSPVVTIHDFLKSWGSGFLVCRTQTKREGNWRDLSPVATISKIENPDQPTKKEHRPIITQASLGNKEL
jgi:hypothetical protein